MSNRKKRITTTIAVIAMLVVSGCGTAANNTNIGTNQSIASTGSLNIPVETAYTGAAVATYTGGSLTKAELDKQYNLQVVLPGYSSQETKLNFAKFYIVWYKYLYPQAVKQIKTPVNVAAAQQSANQFVQQLVGQVYKTQQDVTTKMTSLGLTQADVLLMAEKGQILSQYLEQQMKGVSVTDTTAKAYYQQNQANFTTVTVDQILLKTLSDAKKVEAELKSGANFATLADKVSQDPSVKQNHGRFTDAQVSGFVPEFAHACVTLPLNTISDPVQTQYGYHILKVESRSVAPYTQVAAQIKQQLLQQAQTQKEKAIYNAAQTAAHIQVSATEANL